MSALHGQEVTPVRVADGAMGGDEGRRRGCARVAEQAQAGLVRQAVGLAGVYLALGPHQVLEAIVATA